MRQEVDRCREALRRAAAGAVVSLVSSGDAGLYGMAGPALEAREADGLDVAVEIVPGVTAAQAAAARFGAPLMQDTALVSLSDLLTPRETIRTRLRAAAAADFVIALYNPKSRTRTEPFEEAVGILLEHRPAGTPAGVATAVARAEEALVLTTLGRLADEAVTMQSVVLVGNSATRAAGDLLVTPRGYPV
jgi:precorrin-3B C17-methyltransferase